MKKKRLFAPAILFGLCIIILWFIYRIYHIQELNSRLETLMAAQIIQIQDDWYKNKNLPEVYFIYRNEYWQLPIGQSTLRGYYLSYWVSHRGQQQQLTEADWNGEYRDYLDKTINWMYFVRPASGALVCVFLEGHAPRGWTTNGSVSGYTVWSVDTSETNWRLQRSDNFQCSTSSKDFILSGVP